MRESFAPTEMKDGEELVVNSFVRPVGITAVIAVATAIMGLLATSFFTADEMRIVNPLLWTIAVFIIFCGILRFRIRANLFGEIGFIYLGFAVAYTVLPGIAFLALDFSFPLIVDGLNFVDISPQPAELGAHFWRHFLFVTGVATGYMAVRGGPLLRQADDNEAPRERYGRVIAIWIALIGCCMIAVTSLSASVTTYIEHYTRFDNLSPLLRRFVFLCLIFKSGGYFVLLTLMFREYDRYRKLIFAIVPVICIYEAVYSFGSRIESLTILLAFIGLYHHKVSPISTRKGLAYLLGLAALFSALEIFRTTEYSFRDAQSVITKEGGQQISEFGAVFSTGFHLYTERSHGSLPPRPWPMFLYEINAVIPFLDHTSFHPQYWYARNFFPDAVVPPATMGVIADSALWGGEIDLLVRSLLNGALFAALTRWFLRRRKKVYAITIYVYCYATCVMALKYSVLYHLIPLVRILLPTLLVTEVLLRLPKRPARLESVPTSFLGERQGA